MQLSGQNTFVQRSLRRQERSYKNTAYFAFLRIIVLLVEQFIYRKTDENSGDVTKIPKGFGPAKSQ